MKTSHMGGLGVSQEVMQTYPNEMQNSDYDTHEKLEKI